MRKLPAELTRCYRVTRHVNYQNTRRQWRGWSNVKFRCTYSQNSITGEVAFCKETWLQLLMLSFWNSTQFSVEEQKEFTTLTRKYISSCVSSHSRILRSHYSITRFLCMVKGFLGTLKCHSCYFCNSFLITRSQACPRRTSMQYVACSDSVFPRHSRDGKDQLRQEKGAWRNWGNWSGITTYSYSCRSSMASSNSWLMKHHQQHVATSP